jgi:hypothetical protein
MGIYGVVGVGTGDDVGLGIGVAVGGIVFCAVLAVNGNIVLFGTFFIHPDTINIIAMI